MLIEEEIEENNSSKNSQAHSLDLENKDTCWYGEVVDKLFDGSMKKFIKVRKIYKNALISSN